MTEEQRRKIFIKAAHTVIKTWPGYALPRPAPECETDRYMLGLLKSSQELLICTWAACRANRASDMMFEKTVELWWVERLRAAGIFGI